MINKLYETMTLACKKNGLLVFAARFSYIGQYNYQEVLDKLEDAKRVKYLEQENYFKFDKITKSIGRFSRMPSRVYVYENL